MAALAILFIVLVGTAAESKVPIKIKIIDDTNSQGGGSSYSSAPTQPQPSREPSEHTWPSHLDSLAFVNGTDRCIGAVIGSYTYSVCPFKNITQRDATFWGILGVWGHLRWPAAADTSSSIDEEAAEVAATPVLALSDGTDCNYYEKRSAEITLNCSENGEYSIRSAVEPKACHYHIVIDCPEACQDYDTEYWEPHIYVRPPPPPPPRTYDELVRDLALEEEKSKGYREALKFHISMSLGSSVANDFSAPQRAAGMLCMSVQDRDDAISCLYNATFAEEAEEAGEEAGEEADEAGEEAEDAGEEAGEEADEAGEAEEDAGEDEEETGEEAGEEAR